MEARLCYRLRMTGYDGWLSIEHEDSHAEPEEGLTESLAFLKRGLRVRRATMRRVDALRPVSEDLAARPATA
jgi:hypothetical protein